MIINTYLTIYTFPFGHCLKFIRSVLLYGTKFLNKISFSLISLVRKRVIITRARGPFAGSYFPSTVGGGYWSNSEVCVYWLRLCFFVIPATDNSILPASNQPILLFCLD